MSSIDLSTDVTDCCNSDVADSKRNYSQDNTAYKSENTDRDEKNLVTDENGYYNTERNEMKTKIAKLKKQVHDETYPIISNDKKIKDEFAVQVAKKLIVFEKQMDNISKSEDK